jgi:hypothetical protein
MSDARKIVTEYLKNNGYPFEMFVAQQFKSSGFEIYQSSLYVDTETGKEREIDINAYYNRFFHDVQFSFKVIIECKHANTPWILFSGENKGFEDLGLENFYGANHAGKKLLEVLSGIPVFGFTKPFRIESRMAYGITETADKGKNEENNKNSYKAVMTLMNALRSEKQTDQSVKGKIFEIFVPVIAVKGKLFECYLDVNEKEMINEVNEGQFIYKSNVYPGVFPLIEVIAENRVADLAKKIFHDLDRIYKDHYSEIAHLLKDYPSDLQISFF